jgi:hypothetical protein
MWNKIKPYMPWNLIEFMFFIAVFVVINNWFYDGKDATYTGMIAGAALYIAITNRRNLDNR